MVPILSLRDLSFRLGIPVAKLRKVAGNVAAHYREDAIITGPNKTRTLRIPDTQLMGIQRQIKRKVLDPILLADNVHGGVKGRSPRSNAIAHLAQPWVVNLDVIKFFDEVRHRYVYRMFRHELGFGTDVARLLTRLTTFRSLLPQGAATSTAVANLLVAMPVDGPMSKQTMDAQGQYTRFVDDVTMSGTAPMPQINAVGKLLSQRGLRMYRNRGRQSAAFKLKITPRSAPQEVTGLMVNSSKGPSLSRERRDGVRAAIFNLRKLDDRAALEAEVRSIAGKIAHVRQFNPGSALRLKRYLSEIVKDRQ